MKGYFKCRNCRHLLDLQTSFVCTNHNVPLDHLNISSIDHPDPSNTCEDNHYFIEDSKLNQFKWIVDQLDRYEWISGKINCPNNCGAKIGTFNFVNPLKCNCGLNTVPSVHLIKSRVDFHLEDDQNDN